MCSGFGKVLEPVQAEIGQLHVRRQVAPREVPRGVGDQDLAAVPRRRDSRRLVERKADVVVADALDLAAVDAHADLDRVALGPWMRGEGPLRVDGGRDRGGGVGERHEHRVALRAEDPAAMGGHGRLQQLAVLRQQRRIGIAEPLEHARRTLDVREQEREGAGRQVWECLRGCGRHALRLHKWRRTGPTVSPRPECTRRDTGEAASGSPGAWRRCR